MVAAERDGTPARDGERGLRARVSRRARRRARPAFSVPPAATRPQQTRSPASGPGSASTSSRCGAEGVGGPHQARSRRERVTPDMLCPVGTRRARDSHCGALPLGRGRVGEGRQETCARRRARSTGSCANSAREGARAESRAACCTLGQRHGVVDLGRSGSAGPPADPADAPVPPPDESATSGSSRSTESLALRGRPSCPHRLQIARGSAVLNRHAGPIVRRLGSGCAPALPCGAVRLRGPAGHERSSARPQALDRTQPGPGRVPAARRRPTG